MLDELFLYGSVNRANACARTAANALLGIDFVLAITLADALYGALCLASTASNAIVCNLISHDNYLRFFIYCSKVCLKNQDVFVKKSNFVQNNEKMVG